MTTRARFNATRAAVDMAELAPAIQTFLEGCQRITREHIRQHYPDNALPPWRLDYGARYVRVVRDGSAHAFIDQTNGDVLKPAGWKAPAKHARGNVFDASHGLAHMGPYGPTHLR